MGNIKVLILLFIAFAATENAKIKCKPVNACPGVECAKINFVPDKNCNCVCGMNEANCTGYERFDQSSCSCVFDMGCDYGMECPLGERWDFGVCGCVVNKCPNVEPCKGKGAFNENCECECREVPEDCKWIFDFENCQCLNRCDYIRDCPPGLKWDLDVCDCVTSDCLDFDACGENYLYDGCACHCAMNENSCQSNEIFDSSNCRCVTHMG